MPDPRSPVMILVEAAWLDDSGISRSTRACMVNRSISGTCLRLDAPVDVGSRLTIQWRWEEFTGVTRYCRREGSHYFIGIQRDTPDSGVPAVPAPRSVALRQNGKNRPPILAIAKTSPPPIPLEIQSSQLPHPPRAVQPSSSEPTVSVAAALAAFPSTRQPSKRDTGRLLPPPEPDFDTLRRKELQMLQPPKAKVAGKDEKHMSRKWLGLGNWGDKKEEVNGNNNAAANEFVEARKPAPELAPPAPRPAKAAPISSEEDSPNLPGELMALEDLYRTAGIVNPRKGYNITKVVDM